MKFYDLFAGIGGFRLGLEKHGHTCVGSCEIDKYARQIYAKNFGHEPEQSNITKINPKDLPDFDILCAGFPCQPWSMASESRDGFKDERGGLFYEIIKIAREKQPQILFLENVKGLLSHQQGSSFREMLYTLNEIRYDVEWQVLNSKFFLPQNRERLFIIGHLRGGGRREILPVGQNSRVDDESYGKTSNNEVGHTGALTANYWKGYGAGRPFIAEPKLKLVKNSTDDSYRIYSPEGIARTLRSHPGGMGKMTGAYMMKDFKVRRLTPTECERLQGFPDGFTSGVSDTQRYKMLGNAVTVPVISYISSIFKN